MDRSWQWLVLLEVTRMKAHGKRCLMPGKKGPMAPGGVPSLVHFTPFLLLLLEVDNRRSERRCGLREMLIFSELFFSLKEGN